MSRALKLLPALLVALALIAPGCGLGFGIDIPSANESADRPSGDGDLDSGPGDGDSDSGDGDSDSAAGGAGGAEPVSSTRAQCEMGGATSEVPAPSEGSTSCPR